MSANDPTTAHEEAHTGPIKTPKQLLAAVFFFFLVPIFSIIGLVYYVTSANKPLAGSDDSERAVAYRIQKIGSLEIRDANRALKSGAEVYTAQCSACHATGVAGAPILADAAAWAPRIGTGYDILLNAALKGKGAMGAQGGGDFEDLEIARAVVYMTTSAGGHFPEPVAPAAEVAPEAVPVVAEVPAVALPTAAVAAPAAAATVVVLANNGEAVYKQTCFVCHASGVAGAPKFGDKATWEPYIKTGLEAMYAVAIKGKGAMPPKGGSVAPDADIHAAVDYMVNAAK